MLNIRLINDVESVSARVCTTLAGMEIVTYSKKSLCKKEGRRGP